MNVPQQSYGTRVICGVTVNHLLGSLYSFPRMELMVSLSISFSLSIIKFALELNNYIPKTRFTLKPSLNSLEKNLEVVLVIRCCSVNQRPDMKNI